MSERTFEMLDLAPSQRRRNCSTNLSWQVTESSNLTPTCGQAIYDEASMLFTILMLIFICLGVKHLRLSHVYESHKYSH
ncbi:hypothetical protein BDV38DRAFT_239745 [Aspergillus pseudotamarii]|uniref:Uncharacterized protein n=1 Tax=Aspergillus pseudotamarii TaxID=132259 RepID=A0A5N6T2D8_ASPPS|nr:uncharacterized protein BDV38DRAFT_239745 [Aspergillus pseudotamarii]KAE8140466.1 hypothetical protein BDV38DRAFT_239745 [Aspergillus pseudotamarii]